MQSLFIPELRWQQTHLNRVCLDARFSSDRCGNRSLTSMSPCHSHDAVIDPHGIVARPEEYVRFAAHNPKELALDSKSKALLT